MFKNIWIKTTLFIGTIFLIFISYLFLSSPSKYKVDTPFIKELISFQKGNSSLTNKNSDRDGFCPPPGCGADNSVIREDVNLELTDKQLTALINTLKPKNLLVSHIKIKINSGKIISKAISYYPQVLGNITIVSDLRLNHFYVEKVYIGGIRAPQKIESFVEANGANLIDKAFQRNNIFVKNMQIKGDNFIFEASVPKGMITIEDKVIKINRLTAPDKTKTTPSGDTRF